MNRATGSTLQNQDVIAVHLFFRYIIRVNRLTKQEQMFLIIVLGLLLTGWAVKTYRTAHPPSATVQEIKPKMHEINFDEAVEQILEKDPRFARDAYAFVREALDFTQKLIGRENKGNVRHITGQELLDGIRQFALQQFGPMAVTVFEEWGVKNCRDFGDIVFNMVEISLLAKTDKDSRDDFQNGYDFTDAFRKPFWPQGKLNLETKPVAN
jgi:uncharacterized repeat protein (TIGR04138 family)